MTINLMQIDSLIDSFIKEHEKGIKTIHNIYLHNSDELSIRSLIEELKDELRTGCVTFFNKKYDIEELNPYLFYIVNAYTKTKAVVKVKKQTEYICPGCSFLGKESVIEFDKIFKCDECNSQLKKAVDPKDIAFFKTFSKHNKIGNRCENCDRFIPQPLDNSSDVFCPYFDCFYAGSNENLKKMHHPTIQSNPEKLILDKSYDGKTSLKDRVISNDISVLSKLENQEDFENKVKIIKDVIDQQINTIAYSSSDFTLKHKFLCYQAFSILLEKEPQEMVDYLLNESRSGGFQAKAFQQYISLLEESLPFIFKKNRKIYRVESLLDDNLKIFEGISVFEQIVNENKEIKNATTEFYIGGRKGSVAKPYYIGKLLNIVDADTKITLNDKVISYTFSRIKLKDVVPGTKVNVMHLRVPPHYQMGGMVYVNRVRKKIVDRANLIIRKDI